MTNWERFQQYYLSYDALDFSLDISRMQFSDNFLAKMTPQAENAFAAMDALEQGAIANPDEQRMVGHYWLRNADLAPAKELRDAIEKTIASIKIFARRVRTGEISSAQGAPFSDLLLIGIGGSALGPQFIADALEGADDPLKVHFLDNTDPDGFDRTFTRIGERLSSTLVVVISKSGGTKETRNGMLETQKVFSEAGVDFAKQAVAITGEGSALDKVASAEGWLHRFPMWDWVGGRTSVMSAVGLLPMALQGLDIDAFLKGAASMDTETRTPKITRNAAMLLALMWYYAGDGKGLRDMVVLPYKDRMLLFSKYLQQLVMESLGKSLDLDGNRVEQGIAVYGNKGSTDQHAYVQQLRDGIHNFFVTFIDVRRARNGVVETEVEPGVTSGDYLHGFLRGTRAALAENNRESITISIPKVDAFQVGALIALYERAVGFYATLIHINAYHQPGVEAGKKAATQILELQGKVLAELKKRKGVAATAEQIAASIEADTEAVFHLLCHLEANRRSVHREGSSHPSKASFLLLSGASLS